MIKHVLMVNKFDYNKLDDEKQGIFTDAENFACTLSGIINSTYRIEGFNEDYFILNCCRMTKAEIEEDSQEDDYEGTIVPEYISRLIGESDPSIYPDNYDKWPNATFGFTNIGSDNKVYALVLVTAFEVNALQKIAHALLFPELEVNEDTLSVTTGIVKAYEDNKKVALGLIKKGLIRRRAADEMYKRGISDAIEKFATKFIKLHKTDFVFKQPALICKVSAYSPVLAMASTVMREHGILLDYDDCKNMYHVKLVVRGYTNRADVYDYDDKFVPRERFPMVTTHSFVSPYWYNAHNSNNVCKVMNIIAANVIDGRGIIEPNAINGRCVMANNRYINFDYYITEDEIHDFIRVAKRVLEGKYVFKVKNGNDGYFNVLEDGTVKLINGQLYIDTTVTKNEKEEKSDESSNIGTVPEGEEVD